MKFIKDKKAGEFKSFYFGIVPNKKIPVLVEYQISTNIKLKVQTENGLKITKRLSKHAIDRFIGMALKS